MNHPVVMGLIAVRGGSERVPGKNIRPFAGSSLLEIKCRQLLAMPELAAVVVNSDSEAMLERAESLGCLTVLRAPAMAAGSAPMSEVYRDMAASFPGDIVAYCNATSPLVESATIARCVDAYIVHEPDSANTTTRVRDFLWLDGRPINYNPANQPRSQDLPPIQRITFACSVLARIDMARWGNVVGPSPMLIETSETEGVDIDTEIDFRLAEMLYVGRTWR